MFLCNGMKTSNYISGRTFFDEVSESVRFDNPGVSFACKVSGVSSVSAHLSQRTPAGSTEGTPSPNFFDVFIDGALQKADGASHTFSTEGAAWAFDAVVAVTLAEGLSVDAEHEIVVFKATEAQFNSPTPNANDVAFHYLTLDGPAPVIRPPTPKQRRIEFIGDRCGGLVVLRDSISNNNSLALKNKNNLFHSVCL